MVMHTYNPSILEAEAGGPGVQDQHGLHSETASQKNKQKEKRKEKVYKYKKRDESFYQRHLLLVFYQHHQREFPVRSLHYFL
jgi:hypothetical protein